MNKILSSFSKISLLLVGGAFLFFCINSVLYLSAEASEEGPTGFPKYTQILSQLIFGNQTSNSDTIIDQIQGDGTDNIFPFNGNVGIGTTSPSSKLDIRNGDIYFDAGKKIYNRGLMYIDGEDNLTILNKSGVIISTSGGGNGNLSVEGGLLTQGNISVQGTVFSDQGFSTNADVCTAAGKCLNSAGGGGINYSQCVTRSNNSCETWCPTNYVLVSITTGTACGGGYNPYPTWIRCCALK